MNTAATSGSLDGIAVIGMAGRFPGARNIDELWRNLCEGVESISFFSDQELLEAGVDPALLDMPNYIRARGALGDAELFDAAFFGHSPRVAELMDPQHRLFLECAWAALENAGYDPERYTGRVGVYAGESMNTYLLNNLYWQIRMVASVDSLQAAIGNDKDSLTSEVSYKLNLKGPSVTIQSSSSTSLVAVHQACQSLLNYECDLALAGGVSIHFPEKAGYLYQEGGATSRDGHCRAFDARAQGFVNGHGAGVVVLKRLEEAVADRDEILAVVKGSAVNNDGALKVSYMAPSVDGQAEVIALAQALAGVSPESISYVEAHGTATPIGDPIEIAALTQAFRAGTDKKQFCAIGSIKTNIGHLDTAAGVAGLIKTVLALKHRQIPPSLHFEQPNPQIDFVNSPFYVNAKLVPWDTSGAPRRAGVSSFGMGGTNAHVVLEEAPPASAGAESRPWQLLVLSAKTASALDAATANLATYLRQMSGTLYSQRNILDDTAPQSSVLSPQSSVLADVAYTLQLGRRPFSHRRALVCSDRDDAIAALEARDPERVFSEFHEPGDRPVAFLFSGQGAQYAGMAAGLYQDEPVFREHVDQCAELLIPRLGVDLRDLLYPSDSRIEDGRWRMEDRSSILHPPSSTLDLDQTQYAQPALFVVEYALARLWMEWGVRPQAMIGHSIGEYVAACLAGVFTLEDALALVARRGRLMQEMPGGAMLAVPLPEQQLRPLLDAQLAVAAINGPALCVVAGPAEAIARLERQLAQQGLDCRRLHTSHAFHSAMMDPIVGLFAEQVRAVDLQPPQLPYVSNVTGTWIMAAQATDPDYWARHLRQPVRFADGLRELLREPERVLLEVGPGQSLCTLARQHPDRTAGQAVLPSLRHPHDRQPDGAFLFTTLGKLWLAGVALDGAGLYAHEQRRRVPLPSYPFERQRYWITPQSVLAPAAGRRSAQAKQDLADWFYLPFWKPSLPPVRATGERERWLIFQDGCGLGAGLARRLAQAGQEVVAVTAGQSFVRIDDRTYVINPRLREHYDTLLAAVRGLDAEPDVIVHMWSVTADDRGRPEPVDFEAAQEAGFYSLLFLAQALEAQEIGGPVQIVAVSNNMQSVTGEAVLCPEKATILGLCKVLPQEYPNISCRGVDIVLPDPQSRRTEQLLDLLAAELLAPPADPVVAYRDGQRWVQGFEPVRLDDGGSAARLRERGVYMITGGLGGIGLEIAGYLARTVQARLALIGRSGLPPRADWDGWLATHAEQDGVSRRIRSVRALEELGAEVLVISADVADPEQMRAAISRIHERFGALHGVVHSAGAVGRAFFHAAQQTGRAEAAEQFRAKVHGTVVLEQVLGDSRLDFCFLMSSLSSVLGGLGFGAYAAANLFMDAFVRKHNRFGAVAWTSVNWDAWQPTAEQGQALAPEDLSAEFVILPGEGVAAFERILSTGALPQIVVSTGDLPARLDQWIRLDALREAAPAPVDAAALHPRPGLQNPYIAPRNETERTLAQIWQETLGIEQVGVYDNFFELGGNSLTAIQVIARLKKEFQIQIATVSLYEGPNVSALAKLISPDQPDKPAYADSRGRGARRREKQQRKRAGAK